MIRRSSLFLTMLLALAHPGFSQTISSILPNSAVAGSGPLTLTINGQFQINPATLVDWYLPATDSEANLSIVGTPTATKIVVTVPASLLTTPESVVIYVVQGSNASNSVPFTVTTPPPTLSSLSPNTAVAGSGPLTLTVNGANFPPPAQAVLGYAVTWNGTSLATSYVNSGQLTATVPASLLATAGTATVSLSTANPPSPLGFNITAPLTLSSISPTTIAAGTAGFTLTANGTGFDNTTVVTWSGTPLTTTFVGVDKLTAAVPASLVTLAEEVAVQVEEPASGHTSPSTFVFTVTPTLTSLSPSSATVGGPAFTLTVNGTGFGKGAKILWGSQSLATTPVSANQVTASIPATFIAQTGTVSVTVVVANETSNALTFAINPPPIVLTSISPNTAVAGSAAFTLTANGSGFPNGAAVTWNGTALTTSFVSATQLTAVVPANLVATAGTATVSVSASGQTSPSPLPFTITPSLAISSLSPSSTTAGGPSFTLTVTGTGFNSTTTLYWNSTALTSGALNSGNLISATVPSTLIALPGTASITAHSGNLVSNALTFTINAPTSTLTSISPNTALAGSPAFTLTANGSGFLNDAVITWNGSSLTTTFVSAAQLTASVPANLIATAGTATVGVSASGQASPSALPFTITPGLTITGLSPNSTAAGGPAFTLTVSGTGFNSSTSLYWNTTALTSGALTSSGQLTAGVPAALIAQPGTAAITAHSGNLISNALTFTITSLPLVLTSISPATAVAGSAAFTLTANGSGFVNGAAVTWNGTPLTTTFVSATQLSAAIPANLIATAGTVSVGVSAAGQTSSAPLPFTITPNLTISSLSPSSGVAGGPAFTLSVIGTGFAGGAVVFWNSTALTTTLVNAGQLTAAVPAVLIVQPGAATVTVQSGNLVSNSASFTINAPGLTLTSISPNTAVAGGPAFTLTASGAGFLSGVALTWNGTALTTTFVSATQLTANVPANLIAQQGAATVTAQSGNLVSNALTFTISSPATITLTSISPNSATVGSPGFTITVNGSGFLSGIAALLSVTPTAVTWNGSPLVTTFVSSIQLTAAVPANLLANVGTASVSVTGSPQPSSLPFTILTPLTLTGISPAKLAAAGPAFNLTANGAGFLSTTAVTWNGAVLVTTFVSSTQLTAAVPAALIATPGTASIDVTAAANQTQPPALQLVIAQGLILSSLSPSAATAGGAAFTLTANGSGFASGASIVWNGSPLATTFVSASQLTAPVNAGLIAQAGTASVTVSLGTTTSNALPFAINPAPPVITGISPANVIASGPALTLTVNGSGFVSGAIVSLNGAPLATTFVSATQLTAAVPAALIANAGTASITVANPGTASSNAVNFTINVPTPTLTSISPSTIPPGGPAFTLTVTGTNFLAGATLSLNNTALTTTFVSPTQLTAVVPANLVAQPGTAQITATNPGGMASNAVSLTILSPAPTITSISPSTVTQGAAAFTLTVNGANFLSTAIVSLGSTPLTTTFVSATQLTAAVPANLIAQSGTVQIIVANSAAGPASNAVPLAVASAAPTITSISPSTVTQGAAAFTLTVNGTNFLSTATVSLGSTPVTTTFVSATQLTAAVPANLILQPATVPVTVTNPGSGPSNPLPLTIAPAAPTLTSISPARANVGDVSVFLGVIGTGFTQSAIVQWNGTPLMTGFVSGSQLTATVPSGLLTQPGTFNVTVSNSGQLSNALPFIVNPVTPSVTSLSPSSATAGGPAFSLVVTGTGFLSLTVIQWNSTALTTHYVEPTTVTADVPASLLAQAGTVSVTALNPGNIVSAASTFTINPPAPAAVTSLSQTSIAAGSAAFTLTLTGSGFTSGAVVNFGSTALTTTFVSATQLTAAVPANLLLVPATYPIVVQQSGTSSTAVNFTVTLPAAPSLRLNPPTTTGPAQQPTIDFGLNAAYPLALSGVVTLTFASNATVPIDDPTIQFAAGGRTFNFTVPANTTTLPALMVQTGTVSGVITLTVTLTAAGVNVTPPTGSTATISIAKAAPVIRTITLIHANGYLEVDLNGYSTTRDMTTAVFQLNAAPGASFTSSIITVPASTLFTGWYTSASSTGFGSQFTYAQPFTVIGDTNQIKSVTVTLTNSAGSSVLTSQ